MHRTTIRWQRLEGAALAGVSAALFTVTLDEPWWWLLALFLVVDVSAVGYLAGPRAGALVYNAAHALLAPAMLGLVAVLADSHAAAFAALVWAFHIGIDRALGYGLKEPSAFQHTHLGTIGRSGDG